MKVTKGGTREQVPLTLLLLRVPIMEIWYKIFSAFSYIILILHATRCSVISLSVGG
jgi:hypothetical protein